MAGPYFKEVAYAAGVTGAQPSIGLDNLIAPFQVTVAIILASSGTFGLEYSLDQPDVSDANAKWFASTEVPAGTTASTIKALTTPVNRIRLNIVANATGITLQKLQGLSIN